MKNLHYAIIAVILAILFVVIGFVTTLSAAVGSSSLSKYSLVGYTLTLLAFMIVLWILMVILMHNDPVRNQDSSRRRRRQ
jgi:uncharacterized membrane protein